jgi:hypothetical protein
MKYLIIISIAFLSISCSVEQRIKDYSYTEEWYFIGSERYQIYQTKFGKKYIIKLNKKGKRYKRQYIYI